MPTSEFCSRAIRSILVSVPTAAAARFAARAAGAGARSRMDCDPARTDSGLPAASAPAAGGVCGSEVRPLAEIRLPRITAPARRSVRTTNASLAVWSRPARAIPHWSSSCRRSRCCSFRSSGTPCSGPRGPARFFVRIELIRIASASGSFRERSSTPDPADRSPRFWREYFSTSDRDVSRPACMRGCGSRMRIGAIFARNGDVATAPNDRATKAARSAHAGRTRNVAVARRKYSPESRRSIGRVRC